MRLTPTDLLDLDLLHHQQLDAMRSSTADVTHFSGWYADITLWAEWAELKKLHVARMRNQRLLAATLLVQAWTDDFTVTDEQYQQLKLGVVTMGQLASVADMVEVQKVMALVQPQVDKTFARLQIGH